MAGGKKIKKGKKKSAERPQKESDDEMDCNDAGPSDSHEAKVYVPGLSSVDSKENLKELECDESAYIFLHHAQTGAPCLSFDVIEDERGINRTEFPLTAFLVTGTQAAKAHANSVVVLRMSNIQKTQRRASDNEDDDDDDDDDDESVATPDLFAARIKHQGACNRIRCTSVENTKLAASWSELGKVHIWDLTEALKAVSDRNELKNFTQNSPAYTAMHTFTGHQTEGFALDWSPIKHGSLLSGDCKKNIHHWTMKSGSWTVDQRPYAAHTDSVEDVQWSPNEPNVFASCSVDKSIRIWDTRSAPSQACKLACEDAHVTDVNVISWNRNEPFLVSGGDDGIIKIWDLRQFQTYKPVALFKHHNAAITSVEWHPTDATVLAASGADDQLTLWDLAVERDQDMEADDDKQLNIAPQLLFIHQGQTDIKEVHWHKQLPGTVISTAADGFNIFRTISV